MINLLKSFYLTLFVAIHVTAAATYGATLEVPSAQFPTIQSAIDAASPGDVINVQAGQTYVEEIILKYKTGNEFITIQSSALSNLPGIGTRVSPSDSINMPKLVSPYPNAPVIQTEITPNGPSHHYKLIGLEITRTENSGEAYNLVSLGDGSSLQDSLEKVAHDFVIDRSFIHGTTNDNTVRGLGLNSSNTSVTNSYFSDLHHVGADAQAIASWNGPGNYLIENNYLEGSGENILIGGSDTTIQNLVPSNITIRYNYLLKPADWYNRSPPWNVKNIFELKNAKQITIEHNIFENNWGGQGQSGWAILFTPRNQNGSNPWATVEDVVFKNNLVLATDHGVNILISDDTYSSQHVKNIELTNNLLLNSATISDSNSHGKCIQLLDGGSTLPITNLTIRHNTCIGYGDYPYFFQGVDSNAHAISLNIVDNIAASLLSGADSSLIGNGNIGTAGLNSVAGTTWTFQNNVLMLPNGNSSYPNTSPNLNSYVSTISEFGFVDIQNQNYALSNSSQFKNTASDNTDPGANFIVLDSKKPCIMSGNWNSCSLVPPPPPSSSNVIWENLVGMTSTGNTVSYVGPAYWGKAQSQQTISAGGSFEWVYNGNPDTWVGIGPDGTLTSNPSFETIQPYQMGGVINEFGSYVTDTNAVLGDVMKIAIESDGTVKYYRNDNLVYTSTIAASGTYRLFVLIQDESSPLTVTGAVFDSGSGSGSSQSAYPSIPNVPGTIEIENFDNGGQGIAYNDVFGTTESSVYRANPVENVDVLSNSNASNGFIVYEAAEGEWMEYTVNVLSAGNYDFSIEYASLFNNGIFHIEVDGVDISGPMTANSTGGWGVFQTLSHQNVYLTQGQHIVRLEMDTNSPDSCDCVVANFDKFEISASPSSSNVIWENLVGMTSTGNTVSYVGPAYWGKAQSQQTISAGGSFEWVYNGNPDTWVGIGPDGTLTSNPSFETIQPYQMGGVINEFGSYVTDTNAVLGDVMKIAIESDGTVKYYRNDNLVYTSTIAASGTYRLFVLIQDESSPLTVTGAIVDN